MTADDLELHEKLLRLLKGALNAYETWFNKRKAAAARPGST